MSLLSSYSESNKNNFEVLESLFATGTGEMFQSTGDYNVTACKFYLSKFGSPTGNITASIYLSSTQDGTAGIPTGSALGTSDSIDVSLLDDDPAFSLELFAFSTPVSISDGVYYFLVIEYSGGDGGNNVEVGADSSATGYFYALNVVGSGWSSISNQSLIYYLYGSSSTPSTPTSSMTTTTLQQLINRMNVYTPIFNMEPVRKVNALDQAIRMFRMHNQPPWTQKKTTLRIFPNVFLYPTASDHAQLAMLDDPLGQDMDFGEHPRYVFTSLRDFLEDPDYRNDVAEIWQSGSRFLGVRNKTNTGLTQELCDSAAIAADWAGSDDAGTPVIDNVIFLSGTSSIRVPITSLTGTATITDTFQNEISSTNYQRKYFFVAVYIDSVTAPSALSINLKIDNSNYLTSSSLTTQFAGQPIVTNDWNIFAFDLNTATRTGTISGNFTSAVYSFTESANGNYYFDESFLRGWILQDYWYYSTYNVLNGSTYQQYFSSDSATYELTSVLLGDTAWHDPIMYEACLYLLSDQKEQQLKADLTDLRNRGWEKFFRIYPDNTPQLSTSVYRFQTDYQGEMGWPDFTLRG